MPKNDILIDLEDFDLTEDELDLFERHMDDIFEYKKCECGGEKTNTTHSQWCPLYKPTK